MRLREYYSLSPKFDSQFNSMHKVHQLCSLSPLISIHDYWQLFQWKINTPLSLQNSQVIYQRRKTFTVDLLVMNKGHETEAYCQYIAKKQRQYISVMLLLRLLSSILKSNLLLKKLKQYKIKMHIILLMWNYHKAVLFSETFTHKIHFLFLNYVNLGKLCKPGKKYFYLKY